MHSFLCSYTVLQIRQHKQQPEEMKNFGIIFLLIVVPVAIRCQPLTLGPGSSSGGVPNNGGATNPMGSLLQSLLDYLSGTKGLLNGQLGLSNLVTQLLNNLIGPNGTLTGLVTAGGANAGVLQNWITMVLNLLIGPNGLLSGLLDEGGLLNGLLSGQGGGTNVVSNLFNTLLGPNGLVTNLLGPNGLLGEILGSGVELNLGNLLNSLLVGPNGFLTSISNAILGSLGPFGGLLPGWNQSAEEGGSGGDLLPGLGGLFSGILATDVPDGRENQSGEGVTEGNMDGTSIINTAICQLQAMFPDQNVMPVAINCLNQVIKTDLASAINPVPLNLSCSAYTTTTTTTTSPTPMFSDLLPPMMDPGFGGPMDPDYEMDPYLKSFITCFTNGIIPTV